MPQGLRCSQPNFGASRIVIKEDLICVRMRLEPG